MSADLPQLLAQTKAANASSRALDCALAVALGGFLIDGDRYGYLDADGAPVWPAEDQPGDALVPRYSAVIDLVLALGERPLPQMSWALTRTATGYEAQVCPDGTWAVFATATGETRPLAMIAALLEQLIAEGVGG